MKSPKTHNQHNDDDLKRQHSPFDRSRSFRVGHVFDIEDFTNASPWERFIGDIETQLRQWLIHSQTTSTTVQYQSDYYQLDFFTSTPSQTLQSDLPPGMAEIGLPYLQGKVDTMIYECFGITQYVMVSCPAFPLDEDQARFLLSSLCMAAVACNCHFSLFVPVESGSSTKYLGRMSYGAYAIRYHIMRSRSPPERLKRLTGLELFVEEQAIEELVQKVESVRYVFRRDLDAFCSLTRWFQGVNPVKSAKLTVVWKGFSSGEFVENSVYSDFDEIESATDWSVAVDWKSTSKGRITAAVENFFRLNLNEDVPVGRYVNWEKWEAELEGIFTVDQDDEISEETLVLEAPWHDSCPHGSILSRFVFLTMVHAKMGIDVVAECWERFVHRLRFHWENLVLFPGIDSDVQPDLASCLIFQKIQLLQRCIKEERKKRLLDPIDILGNFDSIIGKQIDGVYLLNVDTPMTAPTTLPHPPLTSDRVQHQQELLEMLGSSPESSLMRAELQGMTLLSDMQAFKAANEGCVFADFIRWYSPADWILDDDNKEKLYYTEDMRVASLKGRLSERMANPGNVWQRLWSNAEPIPAELQQPLFDHSKEAEFALDYLRTISFDDLMYQLSSVALSNGIQIMRSLAMLYNEPSIIVRDALDEVARKCRSAISGYTGNRNFDSEFPLSDIVSSLAMCETMLCQSVSLVHWFDLTISEKRCREMIDELLTYDYVAIDENREAVRRMFCTRLDENDNVVLPSPFSKEYMIVGWKSCSGRLCPDRVYASTSSRPKEFILATASGSYDW